MEGGRKHLSSNSFTLCHFSPSSPFQNGILYGVMANNSGPQHTRKVKQLFPSLCFQSKLLTGNQDLHFFLDCNISQLRHPQAYNTSLSSDVFSSERPAPQWKQPYPRFPTGCPGCFQVTALSSGWIIFVGCFVLFFKCFMFY